MNPSVTDDMVERAARATWEQAECEQAARYGRVPRASPEAWLTAPLGEREVYLRRARAALEAVWNAMKVQITNAMVERAARHLYLAYVLRNPMLPVEYARDFDRLGETTKSRWRQLARETLEVGLGGGDGADNARDD